MFTCRQEAARQDHRHAASACTASTITAEVLDTIKAMGYKYSTKGALTVAVADMIVPEDKDETDRTRPRRRSLQIDRKYKRGFITDEERYRLVVS